MRTHSGFAVPALLIPLGIAVAAAASVMMYKVGNTDFRSKASDAFRVYKNWQFSNGTEGWGAYNGAKVTAKSGMLTVVESGIEAQSVGGAASGRIAPAVVRETGVQHTAVSQGVVPGQLAVRFTAAVKVTPFKTGRDVMENYAGTDTVTMETSGKSDVVVNDIGSGDPSTGVVRGASLPVTVEYKTSMKGDWITGRTVPVSVAGDSKEYIAYLSRESMAPFREKSVAAVRLKWNKGGAFSQRTVLFDTIQIVGRPVPTGKPAPTVAPGCHMEQPKCIKAPCPEIMVCDNKPTPTPAASCGKEGASCFLPGCRNNCKPGMMCADVCMRIEGRCVNNTCVETPKATPTPMRPTPTPGSCGMEGATCVVSECGNNCKEGMMCAAVCTRIEGRCTNSKCVPYPTVTPAPLRPTPTPARTSCAPEGASCSLPGTSTCNSRGICTMVISAPGICRGGVCTPRTSPNSVSGSAGSFSGN